MKTLLIAFGAVMMAVVLAAAGVWLGIALMRGGWGPSSAGQGVMGPWMMGRNSAVAPCAQGYTGPGMMGGWGSATCAGGYTVPEKTGGAISLEEAKTAVERYVDRLGTTDLRVTEVMEFQRNFYAIVAEEDTGIGAMELLVNKSDGAIGPEPGPNMMWNAKYGMHRGGGIGMMGSFTSGEMSLSPAEAEKIAQHWLDQNLPAEYGSRGGGWTTGDADPFYGYYTFHYLQDGEVQGMLSVNGSTGDVWYHSWHGDFVAMVGDDDKGSN